MAPPKTLPYVLRWINGVKDDPSEHLTHRALVAACALVRYADADGRNCYPGAAKCAADMRVSRRTILTGWAELKEAGWLEILPLPEGRRRSHGAVKLLTWPTDMVHDVHQVEPTWCTTGAEVVHDVHPTYPGNRGSADPFGVAEVENGAGEELGAGGVGAEKGTTAPPERDVCWFNSCDKRATVTTSFGVTCCAPHAREMDA